MPEYKLDERLNVYREINAPPESTYIGLGWDENPESKRRHYRRYYTQELENVVEIMPKPSPFTSFNIMRGQSRGAKQKWWPFGAAAKQDDSGEVTNEQVVGKFKGIVTVQSEEDQKKYMQEKLQLVESLKEKLDELSKKRTGNELILDLNKLETSEGRAKFEL